MSTSDNNFCKSKKLSLKIGCFFLIAFLIILFWVFRNIQVDKMISRQRQQVSQTIINTVNEQAKLNLLMPDIVFINIDSTHKKQLNDSISKQIATVLTKKYIGNEKINPSEINFQPFFVFPDSADSKGNYTLTKVQLDELKNHIQFLTSQVDKAVATTKEEVANDIERLNTWVSIWIGVIGFLGIFIPIVINFKYSKELKEISRKAKQAKTKVNVVHSYIEENKKHIEDLKSLPPELENLRLDFDGFKGEVEQAKASSGQALKTAIAADTKAIAVDTKVIKLEKFVLTQNDISKIKDIDASFILYNKEPLKVLKLLLIDIHSSLNNNQEFYSIPMVQDIFRQLALKVHLISFTDFVSPGNFDLLNQFALAVSNIITQPLTPDSYNQALALLNTLNTNLNNE